MNNTLLIVVAGTPEEVTKFFANLTARYGDDFPVHLALAMERAQEEMVN